MIECVLINQVTLFQCYIGTNAGVATAWWEGECQTSSAFYFICSIYLTFYYISSFLNVYVYLLIIICILINYYIMYTY